ncbi:MAG TPA: hypothetical protein ENK55_02860 [Actinobacteria bacterium]|nr:hypothetical protein [Actinomycetota bacterium]
MRCATCGTAEVAVRRGDDVYCSRCVVIRDWDGIIAIVQEALLVADEAADPEPPTPDRPKVSASSGAGGLAMPADPFA